MITIPTETLCVVMTTLGSTLYMSGVTMNKLTIVVEETIKAWGLNNPDSELAKLAKEYIIKGYNDFASYSKNVSIFRNKN